MRVLLLCLCLVSLAAADNAVQSIVADRVLRYVNGDIITRIELHQRFADKLRAMEQQNVPVPNTLAERQQLLDDTLEELTDEMLLIQEADRLGVAINDRDLRRSVRAEAERANYSLQQQAYLLEVRSRVERVKAVLGYYRGRLPLVSPQDLAEAYTERVDEFTMPARRRVYRVIVRPDGRDVMVKLRQELLDCYRRALADPDERIKAVVSAEVTDAYVAAHADPERQLAILLDVASAIDALELPVDAAPQSIETRRRARDLVERHANLRDADGARQALVTLRAELAAITDPVERVNAFKTAAGDLNPGSRPDLGWVEPGSQDDETEAVLANVKAGELSPVYEVQGGYGLVLLADAEEARQQSMAEVSAQLTSRLEFERFAELKDRLVADLRDRAAIQDLEPLKADSLD